MSLSIRLSDGERGFLADFVRMGEQKARAFARAHVLLLADGGFRSEEIARIAKVHRRTVWRIKKRYVEEGLDAALHDKPRSGQPRKYTDAHHAEIIATTCTNPPVGRKRWTILLLLEELRKKSGLETISRETVRLILKKAGRNPGRKKCGASPGLTLSSANECTMS